MRREDEINVKRFKRSIGEFAEVILTKDLKRVSEYFCKRRLMRNTH